MNRQDFSIDDSEWGDPVEIDTSVAHPARRYNYWLGGTENFAADRISGDAVEAVIPAVRIFAQENRRFLRRVVTFLAAEAGVRQFLDIGTGIPSTDNVHEVAQRVAAGTRVVYADNDPIVLTHARPLLAGAGAGTTAYIHADLRDPDSIFGHPELRKTIDLEQPVALLLIAVLHSVIDAADPYCSVARLVDVLPPGSYLAMSHATADFVPAEITDDLDHVIRRENARSGDPARLRDKAEFARFFDGMELVPPGIVPISDWRSELPPEQRPAATDTGTYGAVARIP